MRFSGKSVIVTGAGSGIGRATAIGFAAEGAAVTCADLNGAEATAAAIADAGGRALGVTMDAGEEAAVGALINRAIEAHGGIDVVHANAGISGGLTGLFDQSAGDWAEILRINLIGPFLAIKHAAPRIAERGGGAIVLTASVAGLRSGAGGAAYSASKAGVINLAQTAAQQLSGSGVRVNAVCPGLIETGMTQVLFDRARDRGAEDRIGALNPLRRAGVPDEIAGVVLFLASDAASYLNGQAIAVDGGLSTSHPVTRQRYGQVAT
ncbi:SDR family NAD(P)-dependent oxidoreductase [Sphingomonas sp. Y38-1Y]|uniref:SDR family NAD(P)-dependent oxidoreductase n=1 Tax=Sphingomonas sp. Y38-1Y TaxID=3078265 RepID=UPI0028EBA2B4|nr:SDR family NAD(P)-dependent oxidoreductase [Sphingomonas sp. Y38-1Y]